jgi:hypothetical protein
MEDTMDMGKCRRLKVSLSSQSQPQVVPIDQFFDGNDDIASIGCNLIEHPGIEGFRSIFEALRQRPDVEAIYAQIAELDPGEDFWPFTDTVFVVGSISRKELRSIVRHLEPDDVEPGENFNLPQAIRDRHAGPILGIWWD